MSEEKTYKMGVSIGKRVKYYLIFFAILILIQIWGEELVKLVTASLFDKDSSDILKKVISSFLTLIGAISLIILNFGRDIDLHNLLDKKLFHVREKTGGIIRQEMIKAAASISVDGYKKSKRPAKYTCDAEEIGTNQFSGISAHHSLG